MNENTTTNNRMNDLRARAAALGFNDTSRVGMNVLKQEAGQTVFIKIETKIDKFKTQKIDKTTGKPKEYDFIKVTNLETGEEGLTYWLSGQPRYQLENTPNYVGKSFAITFTGQEVIDGEKINQFDMFELK